MTDSLNCSYLHGELSNSQKQAIIRLIEKKGKDRRYIKNWRPISLLNVDTKIASKALALRLEKVLPFVINEDQYAYVKNRTISDAVRSIDDIKSRGISSDTWPTRPTASSAKIRRYSARLSRIIVLLFNKLITKLVTF